MKGLKRFLFIVVLFCIIGYAYWKFAIPTHRVEVRSELVMLGDLDGDSRWTKGDLGIYEKFLKDPYRFADAAAIRCDLNGNSKIDEEDGRILGTLVAAEGDPYTAEETAKTNGTPFPRPRELYRYISDFEFNPRPQWALPHSFADDPELGFLKSLKPPEGATAYKDLLELSLYSEAVRFDLAWRKRSAGLLPLEKDYAMMKFARAGALAEKGDDYELLLALTELVEDAETLTEAGQPEFPLKLLKFRDHLRAIMDSRLYSDFEAGKETWQGVLKQVSSCLKSDLGMEYDLEKIGPPRNMTNLQNYLLRAEWQYYKSSRSDDDFRALIRFAQNDTRYLRAVSRTSRKLTDLGVENHNLPMVLLFREALRLEGNDKKKAVGLLDEAIRIPYSWIKTIPREALPSSLALDNFLLPGNKEDGADKSRHWNVFGGICLYKSPEEAVDLALKREIQDLKDQGYSREAMTEFFRDLIGDLNGMYHVMTVNPELLDDRHK